MGQLNARNPCDFLANSKVTNPIGTSRRSSNWPNKPWKRWQGPGEKGLKTMGERIWNVVWGLRFLDRRKFVSLSLLLWFVDVHGLPKRIPISPGDPPEKGVPVFLHNKKGEVHHISSSNFRDFAYQNHHFTIFWVRSHRWSLAFEVLHWIWVVEPASMKACSTFIKKWWITFPKFFSGENNNR